MRTVVRNVEFEIPACKEIVVLLEGNVVDITLIVFEVNMAGLNSKIVL